MPGSHSKKDKLKNKIAKVRKADQQDINRVKRWNSRSFNKKKELSGPTEPVFKPTAATNPLTARPHPGMVGDELVANLRNRLAKIENYNAEADPEASAGEWINKYRKKRKVRKAILGPAARLLGSTPKTAQPIKGQFFTEKEVGQLKDRLNKIQQKGETTVVPTPIPIPLGEDKRDQIKKADGGVAPNYNNPSKIRKKKSATKAAATSKTGYMGDASVTVPWDTDDLGDIIDADVSFRDLAQFHRKRLFAESQGTFPQIWSLGKLTGEGQGARRIFDAAHDAENRFMEELGQKKYQTQMQSQIDHLIKEYGPDPDNDTETMANVSEAYGIDIPKGATDKIKKQQKKERMARQRKALRSNVNKGVNKVNPIKPTKKYKTKPPQGPLGDTEKPDEILFNAEVAGRKNDTYIGKTRKRIAAIGKVSKILDSVGSTIPSGYPFYVTSRDTYFSGWGPAKGKNNRLIFGANDKEQVTNLKRNMRKRGDQDQIKVHNKIPKLDFERDYVQSKGLGTESEKSFTKWYEGSKKGFTKAPKYNPKEPPMKDLAKAFDITGDPETAGVMRDTMRTPPKPTDKDRGDVLEARKRITRIRKAGEQVDPRVKKRKTVRPNSPVQKVALNKRRIPPSRIYDPRLKEDKSLGTKYTKATKGSSPLANAVARKRKKEGDSNLNVSSGYNPRTKKLGQGPRSLLWTEEDVAEMNMAKMKDRIAEMKIAKDHSHSIAFRKFEGSQYRRASLTKQEGKYAKYWLLNAKQMNGNGWGVSPVSIAKNINKFIGRPFVVTAKQWVAESEYGDQFEHPYLPTNNIDNIIHHQEKFRVGSIVDVVEKDGDYHAIIEMNSKFANMMLPPFCSPAIFQNNPGEADGEISDWEALHLAGLMEDPAYGARIALLKGSCMGTAEACSVQFKGAKLTKTVCPKKKAKLARRLDRLGD